MAQPDKTRRWMLAALPAALPTWAAAQETSLEGTWGGAAGDLSAQVIVTGGHVLGFYWRDDYRETQPAPGAAGALAFAFAGGTATLTPTGERTAALEVREGARVFRLTLRRD